MLACAPMDGLRSAWRTSDLGEGSTPTHKGHTQVQAVTATIAEGRAGGVVGEEGKVETAKQDR